MSLEPSYDVPAGPCVSDQQRKVRCDRDFLCANCTRAGVQCVPAICPRQRRRRFPERELFEPLHSPTVQQPCQSEDGRVSTDTHQAGPAMEADQPSKEKTTVKDEIYEAKNFWHAINQMSLNTKDDDDDEGDTDGNDNIDSFPQAYVREVVKNAWDEVYNDTDQTLLLGSSKTNVDLATLHPELVQIFRLWQIYLENVNPLLKVTHTPTLQPRIIDAAGDVANISSTLEALIFSIYCVSILSLDDSECRTMLRAPREDLLKSYQFGCQPALRNSGGLRTSDRDGLTALYLYLVSVSFGPFTDPRSVSSMPGLAIRIAQRMGIDNETTYARCTALEGEMRRRLWWSLIIFDNCICEMSDHKATMLLPTWDCRTSLHVNDFDLRPEMRVPPSSYGKPTEAPFTVVRSELGEFIRHSAFHLDFTKPSLKPIAKDTPHNDVPEGDKAIAFEKAIEERYLTYCNQENPLHFMTLWTTRGQLARHRLLEHYTRYWSTEQTDAQSDTAISYALSIHECGTKLLTSPLTKGYLWHTQFHFPFPARIHILTDLKKRPDGEYTEKTWMTMSDNYEARFKDVRETKRFFDFFAAIVLQAWKVRGLGSRQLRKPLELPRIVSNVKQKMAHRMPDAQCSDTTQSKCTLSVDIDNFSMAMPITNDSPRKFSIRAGKSDFKYAAIRSMLLVKGSMD
ncbi:fungal-specific transcription factor domain protein [Aspergillus coremiiformis]|uniref:Fungal-specific transcription factor domain protein n=1 Tax=Aspergillus coremiiformis TaxID=138285 RepID=A0A5N6Z5M1_9EURO|nr:fungal-specific transcription factor domain protein [Aspergillus coremiiformis]